MTFHLVHGLMVTLIALGGCAATPPNPPVGTVGEGFEAFPSARSFDGPGTVYRIDQDKKRFGVTEISFQVHNGIEETPYVSATNVLSLDSLLQNLGVSAASVPASVHANLSRTTTTTIEPVSARRMYVRDEDVESTMRTWAFQVQPASGSVYYLIRETIQAPGLTYKVDANWLASLNVDVKVLRAGGYQGELKQTAGNTLAMDKSFSTPLNVWFKAERIIVKQALGGAPGQYTIERSPARLAELGF